jgi:PAS domain S-box-containing protein
LYKALAAYGLAFLALVAAVLFRWWLDTLLGRDLPLVTLFAAVAVAVWIGGYLPAVLVAILGYLACAYLFIEPRNNFGLSETRHVVGLVAYVLTCAVIISLGETMRQAKKQADVQREAFRVTIASMGDAVITTDNQARITSLNRVAESVTGWMRNDAIGQPLDDVFRIVNEETRSKAANPVHRSIHEGIIIGLANHTLLIRKDGTEKPIDDSAAPIRDINGQVIGCVLIFRDITERRRLEKENAERLAAARFLAAIVESSEDVIITKTLEGVIQSWNAAAERMFGYTPDEAIGKHVSLIIPGDRLDEEREILARLRAGERIEHFETVRKRKNGRPIHISLTVSPIKDEEGHVVGASKIARDITDRKEAEEKIYHLLAELKQSDRRKDEFLATLAHELRGPLAPLNNLLEVMKRSDLSSARLQQYRDTMERQLSQLVRLVDDLIDVSRISRDKLQLRKEPVELASVVRQSIEACRPIAESMQHQIDVSLPKEPIYLTGDPVRLVQIFSNLLSNSCKYTPTGGQIQLNAERQGSDVVIAVRDTGMGIPPDQLSSIFEMFTQVGLPAEKAQGGLGIGLALSKRLVELHDGTIEALSEGPGKGSQFVVRLPILVDTSGVKPLTGHAMPTTAEINLAPLRILIVDDNTDSVESLYLLLEATGNRPFTALDGEQALDEAERVRPEVILLDIGLPKLNGYEVCRRLRQEPWAKSILIVALTGWGQESDRKKSKAAGFDEHMTKPLDFNVLMRLLAEKRPIQASDVASEK